MRISYDLQFDMDTFLLDLERRHHQRKQRRAMNTDEEIRLRVSEALKQAKFDNAMDHERLLNCIGDLCVATGEKDWEEAAASAIRSVGKLDQIRAIAAPNYPLSLPECVVRIRKILEAPK